MATIYVDDLRIVSNNSSRKEKLKKQLSGHLHMKDLSVVKPCLGIRIERMADGIALEHRICPEAVQHVRVQVSLHTRARSFDSGPKIEAETALMKDDPYQEVVGCLMNLAQNTSPDILLLPLWHCNAQARVQRGR